MKKFTIVEEELRTLADFKDDNETEQKYLKDLVSAVDDALDKEEKAWENMSGATKEWMNEAVAASEAGEMLPNFPDSEIKSEINNGGSKKMEDQTGQTSQEGGKKEKKEKKNKRDPKTSATYRIRFLACSHPTWTKKEVGEGLEAEGLSARPGTLSISYSDAHVVMDILKDLGQLT